MEITHEAENKFAIFFNSISHFIIMIFITFAIIRLSYFRHLCCQSFAINLDIYFAKFACWGLKGDKYDEILYAI